MDMMKGGLSHEDLLQEDRLEVFLAQRHSISVDSQNEITTVFLKDKAYPRSKYTLWPEADPSWFLRFSPV
ncbi:hypothetical protein PISMIDRAFT_605992 [Pisolithus microcarpus 441]|uniref:Uncharacterized protein n=1 Tax=Pisolithus microcarpus 441 TaxID=765257 RepID=A0A0C9ZPW6_9AGAM|nr:hypothetical protein BKA83DRAFT_605992 [Pisolithus microcarpus]KIK28124.1 hypothetical protein PISMIDRAFT_605992 [Pisolithus microcarpus 441]